jgi:hypothetical protein
MTMTLLLNLGPAPMRRMVGQIGCTCVNQLVTNRGRAGGRPRAEAKDYSVRERLLGRLSKTNGGKSKYWRARRDSNS